MDKLFTSLITFPSVPSGIETTSATMHRCGCLRARNHEIGTTLVGVFLMASVEDFYILAIAEDGPKYWRSAATTSE